MRKLLLAICMASVFAATPATAQVSVGFDAPGVSIGVNFGSYPQLVPIAGYPVYYAPQATRIFLLRRDVLGLCRRQLVYERGITVHGSS